MIKGGSTEKKRKKEKSNCKINQKTPIIFSNTIDSSDLFKLIVCIIIFVVLMIEIASNSMLSVQAKHLPIKQ